MLRWPGYRTDTFFFLSRKSIWNGVLIFSKGSSFFCSSHLIIRSVQRAEFETTLNWGPVTIHNTIDSSWQEHRKKGGKKKEKEVYTKSKDSKAEIPSEEIKVMPYWICCVQEGQGRTVAGQPCCAIYSALFYLQLISCLLSAFHCCVRTVKAERLPVLLKGKRECLEFIQQKKCLEKSHVEIKFSVRFRNIQFQLSGV